MNAATERTHAFYDPEQRTDLSVTREMIDRQR